MRCADFMADRCQVRQKYHPDSEAGVNRLIKVELDAVYMYLSMASYFDRSDVALPGFANYFRQAVAEEWGHVNVFISYQTKRGGQVKLEDIQKPARANWGSGLC